MAKPPPLGTIAPTEREFRQLMREADDWDRRVYAPLRRKASDTCRALGYQSCSIRVDGCLYEFRDPATGHLIAITQTGKLLRFERRSDGYCYAVR